MPVALALRYAGPATRPCDARCGEGRAADGRKAWVSPEWGALSKRSAGPRIDATTRRQSMQSIAFHSLNREAFRASSRYAFAIMRLGMLGAMSRAPRCRGGVAIDAERNSVALADFRELTAAHARCRNSRASALTPPARPRRRFRLRQPRRVAGAQFALPPRVSGKTPKDGLLRGWRVGGSRRAGCRAGLLGDARSKRLHCAQVDLGAPAQPRSRGNFASSLCPAHRPPTFRVGSVARTSATARLAARSASAVSRMRR